MIVKEMKKLITLVFMLLTALVSVNSFASYTPPIKDGFVTDVAGKLTSSEKQDLVNILDRYWQTSHNTIAVLILSNMNGNNIEDVAYSTFNTWKIGQQDKDNGVLFVLSIAERKSRIETGRGVGGDLTDSRCSEILRNTLPRYLRAGDFHGGVKAVIGEISSVLTPSTPAVAKSNISDTYENGSVIVLIIFLTFAGFFMLIILSIFSKNRGSRRYYGGYSSSSGSSWGDGGGGGSSGGGDSGGSSGGGGASSSW
jgi:uncharacterized protein